LSEGQTKEDPALTTAIDDSLKAYANGDPRYFDFLTDDVRVYNWDATEPIIGRKVFEAAFAPNYKPHNNVAVVDRDVRSSDGQAVVAQTLEISDEGVACLLRESSVWEYGDGQWRMSHINNTLFAKPGETAGNLGTGAVALSPEAVRVVNERIATVPSSVGVAQ
jgi:hypothetical protein